MDINEQMASMFGEDWGRPSEATVSRRTNWERLCCCGHLERHHPAAFGGLYTPPADGEMTFRGTTVKIVHVTEGCRGAMPASGFELEIHTMDREAGVQTVTWSATCPCREFRPVATVDRPNRYFNQRVLADRPHAFATGLRAFRTFLNGCKFAKLDPDWPAAEMVRRFVWIDGAQRCSLSRCKTVGDTVFPTYINAIMDSGMRCEKHR